jgi:hypothetical protein
MANFARKVKDQTDKILRQRSLDPTQGISVSPGSQSNPTPTVNNSSQDLARHKVSGDHDARYYTKGQSDAKYAFKVGTARIVRQAIAQAASQVVVQHNLGNYPIIQVVGSLATPFGSGYYGAGYYGGKNPFSVIEPLNLVHNSTDQVTIEFTGETVGEVVCVG